MRRYCCGWSDARHPEKVLAPENLVRAFGMEVRRRCADCRLRHYYEQLCGKN